MTTKPLRNIIFDLGGVILNIDPQSTVDAFRTLGWAEFYQQDQQSLNRELFYNLEKGDLSPESFRERVRAMIPKELTDQQIDDAWAAMILDIPAERIDYLLQLKQRFRLFLLSNTNEIHRIKFHRQFDEKFGFSFYELFDRNFYSHEMGLRKPNPQIYHEALKQAGIEAGETLFIDDMIENIEAARSVGLKVLHIEPGTLLEALPLIIDQLHQEQTKTL